MNKDKDRIWALMIFLSVVILFVSLAFLEYKTAEKELSQPKYFIEFNNESYELKKID